MLKVRYCTTLALELCAIHEEKSKYRDKFLFLPNHVAGSTAVNLHLHSIWLTEVAIHCLSACNHD